MAKQYCWYGKRSSFGIDILLYQLAFGITLRFFERCLSFRIYLGPFKIYGNI